MMLLTANTMTAESRIGAFGHVVGARYQTPMMMHCCTANASQGLYYAWEGILRRSGAGVDVNLWLNRRSPWPDVWSWLPHEGRLLIRNKGMRQLTVRQPGWAHRRGMRCQVNGKDGEPRDIARLAIFLAGNESRYFVGQTIVWQTAILSCTPDFRTPMTYKWSMGYAPGKQP